MINIFIALFAYLIDKRFGEFRFIRHPIIIIGSIITFFENRFYKDSVLRGLFLVMFVISVVGFISMSISSALDSLNIFLKVGATSILASMFIAHKMLHDSVKEILVSTNKTKCISMLVSRDTSNMSESDIYKASIETYAENLNDGVIAPLLYLLFFGLEGIIIYKAINTMDSMVGYRNMKYEKYGKIAAYLDDIANYIPSRLTALLIMIVAKKKNIFAFYEDGRKHDSPNAGHPIAAMAMSIGVQLGGDAYYFGKLKKKSHFGNGRQYVTKSDVKRALSLL